MTERSELRGVAGKANDVATALWASARDVRAASGKGRPSGGQRLSLRHDFTPAPVSLICPHVAASGVIQA